MLSIEERDPAFGNEAAWDYIATELIGENDRKAVLHYLKGETRPLVRLGTESIRIGSNGAKELLSLLRNIEPNAGEEVDNSGNKVTNSGILPQMEQFHGPVEREYGFLQSFKTMSEGMPGARRMQVFSGLLERKVLLWFWVPSLLLGKSWKQNSCKLGVLLCP